MQKVAVRGDCCICVAGLEGSVQFPGTKAVQAPDLMSDQATLMLAFAADLHSSLATLSAGGAPTTTRMGVATGDITFLVNATTAPRQIFKLYYVCAGGTVWNQWIPTDQNFALFFSGLLTDNSGHLVLESADTGGKPAPE